jgi:TatD DNase family protein
LNLFDAHCHLQDERVLGRADAIVAAASAAGVRGMASCGTRETDWGPLEGLARRHPAVVPFFGLHPWFVRGRSPGWLGELRARLGRLPSGVGEIGLDHVLEPRDDAEQEAVFAAQLDLAREFAVPANLHCRKAWGDLRRILAERGPFPAGLVIHAYSGPPELVPPLAEAGAYFSFSGTLTYARNLRGPARVRAIPPERLLVETDSPDMHPAVDGRPPEGALNEPANLPQVLAAVAGLRVESDEAQASQVWENALRLFAPLLTGRSVADRAIV